MKKFAELVAKYRWFIIFCVCMLTLFFAYSLKDLRINSDFVSYLPESDEAVRLAKYIGSKYGGNLTAIVAIETDDVFKIETLKKIYELTEKLKNVDGVSYVTSLTSIIDIKGTEEGIEIGRLIDVVPENEEDLKKLKEYVLSKNLYKNIVSRDGKVTLIMCRVQEGVDKVKVAKEIKKVVENEGLNEKIYYGGLPFQMIDMNKLIIDDLKFLSPLVGVVIVLVLFLSFRNLRGIVLPFLSVVISTIWTLGMMSILGVPLTIISNSIPVILMAVGSAYGIHIVNKFREDVDIIDPKERAKVTITEVGKAVLLAGITTIAGFLSFVWGSYLIMIREFGIFTGVGVLFAMVVSLALIPSILSLLKPERKTDRVLKVYDKKFPAKLTRLILKARYLIFAFSVIIVIIGGLGIFKITREVSILEYFKPETNVRATEEMLKRNFGGSLPLYILVKGDIQDPEVLNKMKNVQDFLKSLEDVHNPQSIVDVIEEMNYVMGEGRRIPDAREKVSNLIFLVEGEEIFEQLVSPDKDEAIIQAMVTYASSTKISELVEKIQGYFDSISAGNDIVKFEQTGMPLIYKHLDDAIIRSQIQSLILALIFIFLVMTAQLKTFWGGLIGIVPVTLTIVLIYGFMGYFNIPLDIATVLIASVSLGIGIDYSIHFMNRLRIELNESDSLEGAIGKVLGTTGVAILINVLSVSLGFIVLVFASVIPLQRFGIMILLTMFLSGGATLVLLPAIILTFKPKFLRREIKKVALTQLVNN